MYEGLVVRKQLYNENSELFFHATTKAMSNCAFFSFVQIPCSTVMTATTPSTESGDTRKTAEASSHLVPTMMSLVFLVVQTAYMCVITKKLHWTWSSWNSNKTYYYYPLGPSRHRGATTNLQLITASRFNFHKKKNHLRL